MTLLCLSGYLFSKAAAKTSPEDSASQGKKWIPRFYSLVSVKREAQLASSQANRAASSARMLS